MCRSNPTQTIQFQFPKGSFFGSMLWPRAIHDMVNSRSKQTTYLRGTYWSEELNIVLETWNSIDATSVDDCMSEQRFNVPDHFSCCTCVEQTVVPAENALIGCWNHCICNRSMVHQNAKNCHRRFYLCVYSRKNNFVCFLGDWTVASYWVTSVWRNLGNMNF